MIAGAALGTAAALALWWRPVRMRIDAVADWIGGRLEPVLDRGAALIRGR